MILVKYGNSKYLKRIMQGKLRFFPWLWYRERELKSLNCDYKNMDYGLLGQAPVFGLSQYDSIEDFKAHKDTMTHSFPVYTKALIIYTPDQFIEDVHKAVACFEHGQVKYVNQKSCTPENAYEDIFEKEEAFSYQNEYRLLLKNVYCSSPLSIRFFNQSKMKIADL